MGIVPPPRARVLSEQLVQVYQALRERLASLRADATSAPDDLLSHCLGFCGALHTHHTGENQDLFPALAAAHPELGPVIAKLAEDHVLVAGILGQLRDLLAAAPDQAPDPEKLARELDGLTAILESHFAFEERRIAAALDPLGPENQFPEVFAPGLQSPASAGKRAQGRVTVAPDPAAGSGRRGCVPATSSPMSTS